MSDGNKFDVTVYSQPRPQTHLSLEEMGNVLLDAMQGTLICLDHQHVILDVSKTVKQYFGFEQTEIVGLSILLLVEDSERDPFCKFLNNPSQPHDICSVRMMMAVTNEYRQVKVHRKKKFNHDTTDVHSTTASKHNSPIRTILVLTLDDSAYIDITLFDIYKQEFYTKMNLAGEILFEDHRAAFITGYLPQELLAQSIFNFVYPEDRLVKLHALWKCVTTGASKLQWRLNARDGSLVFLQTEYKLISNHANHEMIVARNEVMSSAHQAQFDELQTAWRHQCMADIRGNSSAFKMITPADTDLSNTVPNGECRISVPMLSMYFSTNKLQSLNILGNIFDGTKLTRPLTIQDYIQILIEHDKHLDSELLHLINSIQSLASRQKTSSNPPSATTNGSDPFDALIDPSQRKKSDSDSIVRGILSNSGKYNHEKSTDDDPRMKDSLIARTLPDESSSTLAQLLNGNGNSMAVDPVRTPMTASFNQPRPTPVPVSGESIQQQHIDFMKKYRAAKAKLESQLEMTRTQDAMSNDPMKQNNILNKLSQLENIKNKHLARTMELKRQTATTNASRASEQKDLLSSLLNSTLSPKGANNATMDHNGLSNAPSPLSSLYNSSMGSSPSFYSPSYPYPQRNSPPVFRSSPLPFDSGQAMPSYHESQPPPHSRVKTPLFDEFLPHLSSSSPYIPVNNSSLSVHSYMNVSFRDTTSNPQSMQQLPPPPSFTHHHQYQQQQQQQQQHQPQQNNAPYPY